MEEVFGTGGEWWDNNGGGNYRIGFKVREVEEGGVRTAEENNEENVDLKEDGRWHVRRGAISMGLYTFPVSPYI